MLRTRDFILLFVTIVFLVVAIGVTVAVPSLSTPPSPSDTIIPAEPIDTVGAEVETVTLDRTTRLANLRDKIAASSEVLLSAPEPTITAPPDTDEPVAVAETESRLVQCAQYQLYRGSWPLQGVETTVSDTARQYVISQQPVGTSTPEVILLLSLPLYPSAQSLTCLSSDVVGVALDGSLIRNNEASLYSVFGAETLIGYALDGFPLYGVSGIDEALDECGGTERGGGYRYQLSTTRDHVLSCFRATPMRLP